MRGIARSTPASRPGIPIAIAGLALMLAVAGVGLQIAESRRSLAERLHREHHARALLVSRIVAAELQGHLRLVDAFARRPALAGIARTGQWSAARDHLADLRAADPALATAAIVDASGTLRAHEPPEASLAGRGVSPPDSLREPLSRNGPSLSAAFRLAALSERVVALSAPIRDASGATPGVLQATLRIAPLEALAAGIGHQDGASTMIVDNSGRLLGDRARVGDEPLDAHPLIRRVLTGRSGTGEYRVPGLPAPRFVGYAPVPNFGWGVIVEQRREAAYRPVTTLTARLAAVAIVIVLVGLAAALLATRLIRRIDRERNRSEAILASIGEGVMTTDLDGRILSVNPTMQRLAGWAPEEVADLRLESAYPIYNSEGERLPHESGVLATAIQERRAVTTRGFDHFLPTKDGRRVPVLVTAAPILEHGGRVVGGVEVIRDVSHERETDRLKSSLVSMVSHELRTPLTMILGFSELLLARGERNPATTEALSQIHASSERLARLIDDLLSVSRIESGRLSLRVGALNLKEVVEEVASPFRRRVRVELDTGLPAIRADRDMLLQVLTNLISNAMKYSPPEAPVIVTAQVAGSAMRASVRDFGVGIREDEAGHLFEKFYRSDRPEVRSVRGTGLGLYITKHLIEMQGGQIWAKRHSRAGSTFFFTLPLAAEGAMAGAGIEGSPGNERVA